RHQQAQALARGRVDFEDRDSPSGVHALQVETRNDPVVSEAEGEVRVVEERQHERSSFIPRWRAVNTGVVTSQTPCCRSVVYECDFPVWPQLALLNFSEPPLGIVSVFHFSPAWTLATCT